jgi:hypothetical protein
MKSIFMFSVLLFLISVQAGYSQVAINSTGAGPDQSAILDVNSSDKGFLIPRVSLNSIADNIIPVNNPAVGLLVYNTGGNMTPGIYIWTGLNWASLATMDQVMNAIPGPVAGVFGEMFEYHTIGSSSNILVPSAGTWVSWATASAGDYSGMSFSSSSFIIENTGIYSVAFNCSALMPGGRIVESALFVNGVRQDDSHVRLWLKDGLKSHNISFSCLISLSADDVVTVGFTVDDNSTVKLEMANLSLVKID